MGPNSGGGRKNGGAPNVAARARFSTWKPPAKGKGGGGNDNSEGRTSKRKVDMTNLGNSRSRVASSISVASTRVKSSSAGLPEWIDINAIETINLSRDLLTKLFKYMNSNGNVNIPANLGHNDAINSPAGLSLSSNVRPRIVVTVRSEDTSASDKQKSLNEMDSSSSLLPGYLKGTRDDTTRDADSNIKELEEKLLKLKLAKQNKLDKLANPDKVNGNSSSNINSTVINKNAELLHFFQAKGFTIDEIITNEKAILSRYNLENNQRDSLLLAMLADLSHQTIFDAENSSAEIIVDDVKQVVLIRKAENNIDLADECDVLKSIYEDATSTKIIFLLNSVCCFVELSLTEKDLNIHPKISSSNEKLSKNDLSALCIQFIVYKAGDIYSK